MNVELIDCMGSDLTIVNAARVSFANFKTEFEYSKDAKLINYLAKHNHWTPFGHAQVSFRIKAPVFVARQLVKHQVGLVWNEVSRRYVDFEPEFYVTRYWRTRPDKSIKQGSDPTNVVDYDPEPIYEYCNETYKKMLEQGIAPEMARMILPQSMMTEWIWTGSLAAFARICRLRCAKDSQLETRVVADKISQIMAEKFPVSWKCLMQN